MELVKDALSKMDLDSLDNVADQNGWMRRVYRCRDRKAENFVGPILLVDTLGEALRQFDQVINDPNTQPGQFPADFELWFLGFHHEKGGALIGSPDGPTTVAIGPDFKKE